MTLKQLQPAYHRKMIKEGKMTEEESMKIINEWLLERYAEADVKAEMNEGEYYDMKEMARKEKESMLENIGII